MTAIESRLIVLARDQQQQYGHPLPTLDRFPSDYWSECRFTFSA